MKTKCLPLAIICLVAFGCARATNHKTVPASEAYTDGFEVVVVETTSDGTAVSARSLALKEAEAAVADDPNTVFTISDVANTAGLIESNENRQGEFTVRIEVTPSETGQQIHSSFHYGNRTFWYEYQTIDNTVTPLRSGTNDLNQNSMVHYQNHKD